MMDLTTILIVGFGLFLLYRFFLSYNERSGILGPKRYPFFGSALQLNPGQIHNQFYKMARQYGKFFEIKIFNTTVIVLNTAELSSKAFCADGFKQVCNNRPRFYIADFIYKRNTIVFRDPDQRHGELRKALSKGLHIYGDGIPRFETIVKEEIHRVMKYIDGLDGQEFEMVSLIKRSLYNILSILLIGESATEADVENIDGFLEGQDYFLSALVNTILVNLPFLINLPFWKKPFDKTMLAKQKVAERYFYKTKESREPGEIRGLVDWYLEEQEKGELKSLVSDDVIVASILETLSAGLLTTASILPTAFLCLAHHPEYQTKLQEELDRVVGKEREPSTIDKTNCDFLEAILIETTRYKPGGPISVPHVVAEDIIFEGFKVKANTELWVNLWAVHRDEEIWGDPLVFRPERFLDERGKLLPNSHIYMKSWQVFGIGRRKCPGRTLAMTRMFLYMSCLFQKWSFIPAPGKCGSFDPSSDDFECVWLLNPKPFYCIAKPRN